MFVLNLVRQLDSLTQGLGKFIKRRWKMLDEYAAIVITPDAIRDGVVEDILNDLLAATSMQILWQRRWRIVSVDTIVSMYPRLVGKLAFAQVVKTLMAGSCLAVIVRGENLYTKLREIKGKIKFNDNYTEVEVTGLRLKYRTWSSQELEHLKNPDRHRRQAILDKIFEYRVHTTDGLRETANLCTLCMDDESIEGLRLVALPLYSEVVRIKNETM